MSEFPQETQTPKTYRCISHSMSPTIKAGDKLEVVPYGAQKVIIGDVILFKERDQDQWIVHRVVDVIGDWVHTRGDRHLVDDYHPTKICDIEGHVVAVTRGRKRICVTGGVWGRLRGLICNSLRFLDITGSRLLRPTYQWLADLGIIQKLFRPWIRIKIITVKSPKGPLPLLIVNGMVAGRYLLPRKQWKIRRPFHLLVDVKTLPLDAPSDN